MSVKLIDNITQLFGDDLKQQLAKGARLKIAAPTFSIYAYEALKKELDNIGELEFIFTEPTFTAEQATDKIRKERREFYIPQQQRETTLYGSEFEIQLRNQLTQRAIAKECANWIRTKAAFRSNRTSQKIQSFSHVASSEGPVIYQPVNGFTTADLGYEPGDALTNQVMRIDDPSITHTMLSTFDQLWCDPEKVQDVTDAIISHIETVYAENSPERIYHFILHNLFHEFLEESNEDFLPNDKTGYRETEVWKRLYNFQRDAAVGIINKLDTYNGCILADSVGLGKTFTALGVIKYYELRNKRVLVLCPKKLGDNWKTYNQNLKNNILIKDNFRYDVFYHTDILRDSGESNGVSLAAINWGNYDLVVIDESHNFRNNPAYRDKETRYQRLLNEVIREGVDTRVLMLSATPVNNRFTDLKNQLALAYEGHSESLQQAIGLDNSIEGIFNNAQKAFNFWSKLDKDERTPSALLELLDFDFFELLDAVTIARSRKHIETFYDTEEIGSFPERLKPISHRCSITEHPDVPPLFEIVEKLSSLTLSVYRPTNFVHESRKSYYADLYDTQLDDGRGRLTQTGREDALKKLMLINLLKRMESSVHSFRRTLRNLADNIREKLSLIQRFEAHEISGDLQVNTDIYAVDDEEENEFHVGKAINIRLSDMDLLSWQTDLRADLAVIDELYASISIVTPEHDTKLQHLHTVLDDKIRRPINPGNRKILIFTAFSDTADYLYEHLSGFAAENGLHLGLITGSRTPRTTHRKHYDFQQVLALFSPKSKDKALLYPDDPNEIDILIATDCISEGQNLQDCDYVINYDIHWNPVRIIQRFGRIDRIGSENAQIQLVNYWPDIELDEYINLKDRVENRMILGDITASGDENVLTSEPGDVGYRHEQLQRLQSGELVDLEDARTGVTITDLGLNDFRADLLQFQKEYGDLHRVPNGLHAVVPASPAHGRPPGVLFALKNVHNSVNINQQNRLHPFYLIYMDDRGEVVIDHTKVKSVLDHLRALTKGHKKPILHICERFNERTHDGRDMEFYSDLLTEAIESMMEIKAQKDIDSLFSGRVTSALEHDIQGLKDFELIAFLVIE